MIVVTYAPKDSDPREFKFEGFDDLSSDEAETVELAGAGQWASFGGWVSLIGEGNMRSWRALLWLMLRREKPDLAFNDVKLAHVGDLQVRADVPGETVVEGKSETSGEGTDSE